MVLSFSGFANLVAQVFAYILNIQLLIKIGCNDFLLDNMKVSEVKKCLKLKKNKNILFEISGGINNKNIVQYSRLGADYISAGFITQNPDFVSTVFEINDSAPTEVL